MVHPQPNQIVIVLFLVATELEGTFLICVGDGYRKYLQVCETDSEINGIVGKEKERAASTFKLEKDATGGFKILFDGDRRYTTKYVALNPDKKRGRNSIQVIGRDAVRLTLEGGKTIHDWMQDGCRVKTPDGYFGFNEDHNMVEHYASSTRKPLLCKLKKKPVEAGGRVLREPDSLSPEPPVINN